MTKKHLAVFLTLSLLLGACQAPSKEASDASGCAPDEGFGCVVEDSKSVYDKAVNDYREISFDEAIDLFEQGGSGLLYFGFPACPWCDELVPILTDEAKKQGVEVLYVRTRDGDLERLYTDEQRDRIQPFIKKYMRLDDKLQLALYVPLVVAAVDGEAVDGHQGTVSAHDAHERKMTDEERAELEEEIARIVSAANGTEAVPLGEASVSLAGE